MKKPSRKLEGFFDFRFQFIGLELSYRQSQCRLVSAVYIEPALDILGALKEYRDSPLRGRAAPVEMTVGQGRMAGTFDDGLSGGQLAQKLGAGDGDLEVARGSGVRIMTMGKRGGLAKSPDWIDAPQTPPGARPGGV